MSFTLQKDSPLEIELMSVENSGIDQQKIMDVHRTNREEWEADYNVALEEFPEFFDSARGALDHLRKPSETPLFALIDRDLEYLEVALDEQEVRVMERPAGSDRRDGVSFLTELVYSQFQAPGFYREVDVAGFYTADPDKVMENPKFRDLVDTMNSGKGPFIFVQPKGTVPTNEVNDLIEAGLTVYTVSQRGMFGADELNPAQEQDMRRVLVRMVTDANHDPDQFLKIHESFGEYLVKSQDAGVHYCNDTVELAYQKFTEQ